MNEDDWLACRDPRPMVQHLRGRAGERKTRLVLCGWTRHHWDRLDDLGRTAVECSERYADGLADDAARERTNARLRRKYCLGAPQWRWLARFALEATSDLWAAVVASVSRNPEGRSRQADVIRDVFGPLPFRPVTIDPAVLAWNHGTVPAIARHVYDDRAYHDLPLLADALEDAGSTDPDILVHCRGPGPHVRGCWVVDLLLGQS